MAQRISRIKKDEMKPAISYFSPFEASSLDKLENALLNIRKEIANRADIPQKAKDEIISWINGWLYGSVAPFSSTPWDIIQREYPWGEQKAKEVYIEIPYGNLVGSIFQKHLSGIEGVSVQAMAPKTFGPLQYKICFNLQPQKSPVYFATNPFNISMLESLDNAFASNNAQNQQPQPNLYSAGNYAPPADKTYVDVNVTPQKIPQEKKKKSRVQMQQELEESPTLNALKEKSAKERKKEQEREEKTVPELMATKVIDFIFPPDKIATLPNNAIGNYIKDERKKSSEELVKTMQFLWDITQGSITFKLYSGYGDPIVPASADSPYVIVENDMKYDIKECKTGLAADGTPFIVVDEKTLKKIKENYEKSGRLAVFENYVTTAVPEGGVVLLEGSRDANGVWHVNNLLTGTSAQDKMNTLFGIEKQHFEYLNIWARDIWAKSPDAKFIVKAAGRYGSIEEALMDDNVNSVLLLNGMRLLMSDNDKMDEIWVENVPFGSFKNHVIENRQLIFAKSGDEYWVVDCQSHTRGKGKSLQEAIADLSQSGFVVGIYRRYEGKKTGEDSTPMQTDVIALPKENLAVEILNYIANAEIGYIIPSGWGIGIGAIGTLGRIISRKITKADLERHKGAGFDAEAASSLQDWSDVALGLGMAIGLGRLGYLKKLVETSKTFKYATGIASGTFFAGAIGSSIAAEKLQKKWMKKLEKKLSSPRIMELQNAPSQIDSLQTLETKLVDLYKWSYGVGNKTSEDKMMEQITFDWGLRITGGLRKDLPFWLQSGGQEALEITKMLEQRVDWIDKHRNLVEYLAKECGWTVPGVTLYLLMFGGPFTEGQTKFESRLSKLKHEDLEDAARYLYQQSLKFGVYTGILEIYNGLSKIYNDLLLGFLDGRVPLSEIEKMASEYRSQKRYK